MKVSLSILFLLIICSSCHNQLRLVKAPDQTDRRSNKSVEPEIIIESKEFRIKQNDSANDENKFDNISSYESTVELDLDVVGRQLDKVEHVKNDNTDRAKIEEFTGESVSFKKRHGQVDHGNRRVLFDLQGFLFELSIYSFCGILITLPVVILLALFNVISWGWMLLPCGLALISVLSIFFVLRMGLL